MAILEIKVAGVDRIFLDTSQFSPGTGNWVFVGNNADLSAAGVMGIGLSTATSLSLGAGGAARLAVTSSAFVPASVAGYDLGTLGNPFNNVYVRNALSDSGTLTLQGNIQVSSTGSPAAGPNLTSTGVIGIFNSLTDGFSIQSGIIYTRVGGGIVTALTSTLFYPQAAGSVYLGYDTQEWRALDSYWLATKLGAQLTISGNAITPTSGLHHVVGGTLLKTINTTNVPPAATNVSFRAIVDTSALTWDATGNISVASSSGIPVNSFVDFQWDGSKWNPSRVS